MSLFDGAMTKKVGPLPLWGWAVGLGAVLVAYMYVRQSQSASSGAATPIPTTGGVVDTTGSSMGGSSGDPFTSNGATNQQWENAAIMSASKWGLSPTGVQSALDKYLNGYTLNSAEQNAVNKVIGTFGAAPEPLTGLVNGGNSILEPAPAPSASHNAPTPSKPKPATKPKPAPVHHVAPAPQTYKIQWGDTLSGIAAKHHTTVAHLASINHISNPNLIYAGHTLRLN